MDLLITRTDIARRLEKACEHVSELWFPVNIELVKNIQAGLQLVTYDDQPQLLVSEIRCDFSLYTYCLREVCRQFREESVTPPPELSPSELLCWAGVDRLREILLARDCKFLNHRFDIMSEHQSERLVEAMTSATTAGLVADTMKIISDVGYTAALLRQLSYALIAWNYPTLYDKAVSNLSPSVSLDESISRVLGFTPQHLGATLAERWGLPDSLCSAVSYQQNPESPDGVSSVHPSDSGRAIAELCFVGEALGRANNPDVYPSARIDWDFAKETLTQSLGPKALNQISASMQQTFSEYFLAKPELGEALAVIAPDKKIVEFQDRRAREQNPYLLFCNPDCKRKLKEYYVRLSIEENVQKNLQYVLQEVAPATGFSGGCILTVESGIDMLIPRAGFGKIRTKFAEPTYYLPYSQDGDFLNQACRATEPVSKTALTSSGSQVTVLALGLGGKQRYGALLVELPNERYAENPDMFKAELSALAQAINDCVEVTSASPERVVV